MDLVVVYNNYGRGVRILISGFRMQSGGIYLLTLVTMYIHDEVEDSIATSFPLSLN